MLSGVSKTRRIRTRALQTSGIAIALCWSGQAFAQCAPEPTQASGTTTCTGTDSDGLRVTTAGTRVVVGADATVLGSGGPAVAVLIPSDTSFFTPVSVEVAGRVDGGAQAGVRLVSPATWMYQTSPALNLNVAAGGTVTGLYGAAASQSGTSSVAMAIDNAGTITGSSGIAVLGDITADGYYNGISSMTNRAGGFIGAISGAVGTITNAGTINGGARSAIDPGINYSYLAGDLVNEGTIINATATAATLANMNARRAIKNSGLIINISAGAAIAGDLLSVSNSAGGRIASNGITAIFARGGLDLTNAGTIDGDVVVETTAPAPYGSSRIDSSAGTINGDLVLGDSADTLVATYGPVGLVTGITGTIDGGAGIDTLRVEFAVDQTLSAAIPLPTNFDQMTIAPGSDATVTLANGFTVPADLRIAGAGTIVNRTTLRSAGRVFTAAEYDPTGSPTFINAGLLGSGSTGQGNYGLFLRTIKRFENTGIITAAGDGIYSEGSDFANSGTITAVGDALVQFGQKFENSGTIRSVTGVGAILAPSGAGDLVNTGRIEGARIGVRISGTIVNSGVILSAGAGVGLDWNGVLDNRARGVVTGGAQAVGSSDIGSAPFNAIVANAGIINGDVVLSTPIYPYQTGNRFFALPGGVLNGNLLLGNTDTLIAELANATGSSGPGAFAGITGTVSGTGALLRYRVREDASTMILAPATFAGIGYDLFDGAALTLTSGGATLTRPLVFAGKGSVDLTANMIATTGPVISTAGVLLAPGETRFDNDLAITSRGTLTLSHADGAPYLSALVALASGDSFTNGGTLSVVDNAGTIYSPIVGIRGGKQVTNAGTIRLGGTMGIQSDASVVNSGTIVQIAGARAATGVGGYFSSLTNSGTIDVGGVAVQLGNNSTIINSGRIASSGAAAIATTYSSSANISNLAGGVIAGGGAGPAIAISGGTLSNAGTIIGSVDLGYTSYGWRSSANGTYIADGGTISGDLRFGDGADMFVAMGEDSGVSGTIDAGAGQDTYVRGLDTSGTITLGALTNATFELEGVRAVGADTVLTVRADAPFNSSLYVSGDGSIVNTATINGNVWNGASLFGGSPPQPILASFTNEGSILGGFAGGTHAFRNNGTIENGAAETGVLIRAPGGISFDNSGSIASNSSAVPAVSLLGDQNGAIVATNSGAITGGGFHASLVTNTAPVDPAVVPSSISLTNSGVITSTGDYGAVTLSNGIYDGTDGSVTLDNSGTIDGSGPSGIGASLTAYSYDYGQGIGATTVSVTNSGTIRANGGGVVETYYTFPNEPPYVSLEVPYTNSAIALALAANLGSIMTVTNTASGVIEATGALSTAVVAQRGALDLTNDGTIRGGAGTVLADDDLLVGSIGRPYLAGAIQTVGDGNDRIVNNGTIIGSIDLSMGDDRIENYGRIDGNVFLGLGDDTFLQRASATLIGTVDAGDGVDSFIVDATGGGTINGDQFVNFEHFSQIGEGNVTYAGAFRIDTIGVNGGSLTIAAGQTLSSDGAITITGSDSGETVTNNGTVAGSANLGGGNDRFLNYGNVLGSVALGDGDDRFVEGAGSRIGGTVDGGAGNDIYAVLLSGDRSGIGGRTGFERLAIEGSGTLALTLDQNFNSVSLGGAGLNLQLAGFTIGLVSGSDAAESLTVDDDIANIALGGGDDRLTLGALRANGFYLGQGGNDVLRFAGAGPVTLSGTATGFEQILLSGGALIVTGTLGMAGETIGFGEGDQFLTIANGGTLAGAVDLGAGNDSFRLIAGGGLNGWISGGAGSDTALIDVSGGWTLTGGLLRDFEILTTDGDGELTVAGQYAFERVTLGGNLLIGANGALGAGQLVFGAGDDRMTIAGRFAGSVDGGAGMDTIGVSGGTADAPVAFSTVGNIETFTMSGGYATLSGSGAFGNMTLTGGRFVGLAGSSIAATQINVGPGATFGSAGSVTGNLAVAGTLSPGASPGTMTVTGNVALAGTSLSLFELTPTVSDKLIVNGTVSIAPGATLQLATSGTLRPGASYDLITATGGITGSYTTVIKPDALFGFLVQDADSIRLLGQFLSDTGFTPQVRGSIAYANATLAVQPANSDLFAVVPALLTGSAASNPQAFAQLTPEPYAAATQMGVDNALVLTDVARGAAFGTGREEAGIFTFAQTLAQWHRLGADPQLGSSAVSSRSYGFLGGVGFGSNRAMVGAFAGYLNDRQQIGALGARNKTDGFVAGVNGRWSAGGLGLAASVLYDGGTARTDRVLPDATSAAGRYALHSWVGDLSVSYAMPLGNDWEARPKLGLTYVRTTRSGAEETGTSPFALTVARDRHVAGFGDAALSFGRSEGSQAALRPFVSVGARYQLQGMRTDALAGYADGGLGLNAFGPSRARLVGTVASGVAYRVGQQLDLFASASSQVGTDDHQEAVSAGARLRF